MIMRAVRDLAVLRSAVARRLSRFRNLVAHAQSRAESESNRIISYTVIELDNLIISSNREFVVSSLAYRARRLSGGRVSHQGAIADERDAILHVMRILEPRKYSNYLARVTIPRREEPVLRDRANLRQIMASVSATNLPEVDFAVNAQLAVFSELKEVRHFFAHRNRDTFMRAATALGFPAGTRVHPASGLLSPRASAPVTFIEQWLDDVDTFYSELLR
jgi:hypothetical protein